MTTVATAGVLLIVGSVVFVVGAAIGVPRVFGESNPQIREQMLEKHRRLWRIAQPFYGLGALIAGVGVGCLAVSDLSPGARATFAAAGVAMTVGALAWVWSLYLRSTRVSEFAYGALPGWPFTVYVVLTVVGLALLGAGLLATDLPAGLGWLILGTDLVFLAAYLRLGDIPPFVFYVLLLVTGIALVRQPG